jgi:hypothetical protein
LELAGARYHTKTNKEMISVTAKARTGHPERGRDAPTEPQVRLSVNLSSDVAGELKQYASHKGISITEAVRRAITVLTFVENAQSRGASLHIEEGGALKEILILS